MYKVECRKLIASPFFLLSVIALYFVILLGIRDFYPENEISSMLETGMGRIGLTSLLWMTTLGIVYLTISLYSNSSLSLFVIGIFYVLEILRNGIGFFPYEFTVLNIILFYFNFFFLRMWIILETATSSSISIPTCQYSLLFYSIILALSIILGLKWTKKFDFQLKNIFTTSY